MMIRLPHLWQPESFMVGAGLFGTIVMIYTELSDRGKFSIKKLR